MLTILFNILLHLLDLLAIVRKGGLAKKKENTVPKFNYPIVNTYNKRRQ